MITGKKNYSPCFLKDITNSVFFNVDRYCSRFLLVQISPDLIVQIRDKHIFNFNSTKVFNRCHFAFKYCFQVMSHLYLFTHIYLPAKILESGHT
jgi:hypothetical protein